MYLYTPLGRYISLRLSDPDKYGPWNHNGRWLKCYRYDIKGRIDTHMSLHTSHSHLSCNIGLVRDNIALEIITGGVCTANVTISRDNFWTKCLCLCPFDDIQVKSDLNPANIALEIITTGDCNPSVTISRGELISTCHCIHPIHI